MRYRYDSRLVRMRKMPMRALRSNLHPAVIPQSANHVCRTHKLIIYILSYIATGLCREGQDVDPGHFVVEPATSEESCR